jgi:hypothetical protein
MVNVTCVDNSMLDIARNVSSISINIDAIKLAIISSKGQYDYKPLCVSLFGLLVVMFGWWVSYRANKKLQQKKMYEEHLRYAKNEVVTYLDLYMKWLESILHHITKGKALFSATNMQACRDEYNDLKRNRNAAEWYMILGSNNMFFGPICTFAFADLDKIHAEIWSYFKLVGDCYVNVDSVLVEKLVSNKEDIIKTIVGQLSLFAQLKSEINLYCYSLVFSKYEPKMFIGMVEFKMMVLEGGEKRVITNLDSIM